MASKRANKEAPAAPGVGEGVGEGVGDCVGEGVGEEIGGLSTGRERKPSIALITRCRVVTVGQPGIGAKPQCGETSPPAARQIGPGAQSIITVRETRPQNLH